MIHRDETGHVIDTFYCPACRDEGRISVWSGTAMKAMRDHHSIDGVKQLLVTVLCSCSKGSEYSWMYKGDEDNPYKFYNSDFMLVCLGHPSSKTEQDRLDAFVDRWREVDEFNEEVGEIAPF